MNSEQAAILALHAAVQAIIAASSNENAAQIALALSQQIEQLAESDAFLKEALLAYQKTAHEAALKTPSC